MEKRHETRKEIRRAAEVVRAGSPRPPVPALLRRPLRQRLCQPGRGGAGFGQRGRGGGLHPLLRPLRHGHLLCPDGLLLRGGPPSRFPHHLLQRRHLRLVAGGDPLLEQRHGWGGPVLLHRPGPGPGHGGAVCRPGGPGQCGGLLHQVRQPDHPHLPSAALCVL